MSYNVRYFGHALRGLASTRGPKRGIARKMAALDPIPDVVCLQEVETASLRANLMFRRRPNDTQLESFMAELEQAFIGAGRPFPYEAVYFHAHRYRAGQVAFYTTGLAILVNVSRLRIIDHNALEPERITHHHTIQFRRGKQTRICAHLAVGTEAGQVIHVFNTHLSLPTPFALEFWTAKDKMGFGANQLHEARALCSFVRRTAGGEPFVVCGDFNSPPGSPVYRHMTETFGLSGAQQALGHLDLGNPRHYPTAGVLRLRMHLDHLFAGAGVRWIDLDDTAPFGHRSGAFHSYSDHVPLIARLELPG